MRKRNEKIYHFLRERRKRIFIVPISVEYDAEYHFLLYQNTMHDVFVPSDIMFVDYTSDVYYKRHVIAKFLKFEEEPSPTKQLKRKKTSNIGDF